MEEDAMSDEILSAERVKEIAEESERFGHPDRTMRLCASHEALREVLRDCCQLDTEDSELAIEKARKILEDIK